MAKFVLSPAAEADIEGILAWTHKHFGETVRLRYEALIVQAILDVAVDAERPGCVARPELSTGACTYHLFYSRNHVSPSSQGVKRPRHFLLFRIAHDGIIEIGRVLHDSMELTQHMPSGFE